MSTVVSLGASAHRARRQRSALRALALFELRLVARSRWSTAGLIAFAILAAAVTAFGLSGFRQLGLGAASPAAIALLDLMLLVPSGVALVLGALAVQGDRASGFLGMLLAAGVGGGEIAVVKLTGVTLASGGLVLAGFGSAALVLAGSVGASEMAVFAALLVVALLTTSACAAIGVLVSSLAVSRHQAVTVALGVWFLLAIGLDLLLFAIAPFVRASAPVLFLVLGLDPIEAGRVLGLLALGADATVLGPFGTFARATLGIGRAAGILVGLDVLWIGLATLSAGKLIRRPA